MRKLYSLVVLSVFAILLVGCDFIQDFLPEKPAAAGILARQFSTTSTAEVIGRQFVTVGEGFNFTIKVLPNVFHHQITMTGSAPTAGVTCSATRYNLPQDQPVYLSCGGQQNSHGEFSVTVVVDTNPQGSELDEYVLNFIMTAK